MVQVCEIPVVLPHAALPAADWGDAYRVSVARPYKNARAAGEAAFATFPPWVYGLMAVRNAAVAPFGLKAGKGREFDGDRVGFFPVIAQTDDRLVVGLNDRHLDFRCVLELETCDYRQDATITTVLKRHNFLGRAYLAVIAPFHRAILRLTMKRLARRADLSAS